MMIASGRGSTEYTVSVALAGSAIFSALFLHQKHSGNRLATAPDIVRPLLAFRDSPLLTFPSAQSSYIVKVESIDHGLRPLALTFTLPHALTTYAAVFLAIGLIMQSLESVVTATDFLLATAAWCLPLSSAFFLARVF